MHKAKTANMSNFWIFWSITLFIKKSGSGGQKNYYAQNATLKIASLYGALLPSLVYFLNYRPECLEVADFAVFCLLHS